MFCTEEIWLCQKHIFSHKKSFAESSLSTISRHFSVKSQLRVSTRFDEKLNKFGWHTSRKWKNTFVETNLPLFSQHVSVVASETCRGQQCRYLRSLTKLFWGLCTTILAHRKKYNVFLVRLSLHFWQQNVLANPHPGSRQRRLADLSKMRTTTPL